jgi:ribosomal protein S18 acetylase RimI-like enzyme
MISSMEIERASSEDAGALAAIFTAARHEAMPWLPRLHSAAEDRDFIGGRVMAECEVLVVRREGRPAGFLALSGDLVEHLYVSPGAQRAGIGSALLDAAKRASPDGLRLWVFQRNQGAVAFYERHGFSEVERTDGSANEEREPDALLAWRPDDARR